MRTALLALVAVLACAASPDGQHTAPKNRTALGLDYVTHPFLLDAIRAQRPTLLSPRGGQPPLIILNDGIQPVPLEMLSLIPTRDVTKLERRIADVTQVGNVATLRVTFIVGPLPEDGMALDACRILKMTAQASEDAHRLYMRRCYLHEDT